MERVQYGVVASPYFAADRREELYIMRRRESLPINCLSNKKKQQLNEDKPFSSLKLSPEMTSEIKENGAKDAFNRTSTNNTDSTECSTSIEGKGKRNSLTISMGKHIRVMSMKSIKDRLFKKDQSYPASTSKLLPHMNDSGSLRSLQISKEEKPEVRRSLSGDLPHFSNFNALDSDEKLKTSNQNWKKLSAGNSKPRALDICSAQKGEFVDVGGLGGKVKRNSLMSKLSRSQRKHSTAKCVDSTKTLIKCGSLKNILESSSTLALFLEFLKSEFSEENLNFWLKVEEFKEHNTAAKAQEIFSTFIKKDAIFEININSTIRQKIEEQLTDANTELFDEAQESVYKLMESDSFKRFKRLTENET